MSRSPPRNEEEVRNALVQARKFFDESYVPALTRAVASPDALEANLLEAHTRSYFIDHALAALGWRMDMDPKGLPPSAIVEATVRSRSKGSSLRLDYFGFERETNRPLMVVETKRPSFPLPFRRSKGSELSSIPDLLVNSGDQDLTKDWVEALEQVREYVAATSSPPGEADPYGPARLLITNGSWLIAFRKPQQHFVEGQPSTTDIDVYLTRQDWEDRAGDLFRTLSYSAVSREAKDCSVADLLSFVNPNDVCEAAKGLRVIHTMDEQLMGRPKPRTDVSPVVALGTKFDAWIRVNSRETSTVPSRTGDAEMRPHLKEVEDQSSRLLAAIQGKLARELPIVPTSDLHRRLHWSRNPRHFLVTGDRPHFIGNTTVAVCLGHDWQAAQHTGVARENGVFEQGEQSLFPSNDVRHCAHADVEAVKRSSGGITDGTAARSLHNSSARALCRLWAFEQTLCCRACTFLPACSSRTDFSLPCGAGGIPK